MDFLVNRRTNLERRITSFQKVVDAHATKALTSYDVRVYVDQLNKLIDLNSTLHDEITMVLPSTEDSTPYKEARNTQDLRILGLISKLHEISSSYASTSPSNHQDLRTTKVRLPQLNLPTFNGNSHDWTSFRDLFKAAIHGNDNLTDAQKLQYLKLSLTGEPALLLKSFSLTDASYTDAWNTLTARYENTFEIIRSNFDRFVNQSNAKSDNPVTLQKLIDTSQECYRAICNAGADEKQVYELLVMQLMLGKLDDGSRLQWESTVTSETLPTLEGFCKALRMPAKADIAAKNSDSRNQHQQLSEGRKKEADIQQGTAEAEVKPPRLPCICFGEDGLFRCPICRERSMSDCWHFGGEHQCSHVCLRRDCPEAESHFRDLQLVVPRHCEMNKTDILSGCDIFLNLPGNGMMPGQPGEPIVSTKLGGIVGGKISCTSYTSSPTDTFHAQCNLDEQLRKIWELEEIHKAKVLTPEEKACETHFATTHRRKDYGQFIVRLPFKSDGRRLGVSRDLAIRRLKALEKKHSSYLLQQKKHNEVLEEYVTLNHTDLVPESEIERPCYYMLHHAVVHESSTTTKYRVVFDASASPSSGVSLNEMLMGGPKLQDELVAILTRFRKHKIAISADITKMYRQVEMHKDDVDFQRIVWRENPSEPIRDWRLLTATFGTSAAPFLAIKSLQQLVCNEDHGYPAVSKVLLEDFYVDDLMSGAPTEEEAILLQRDLSNVLARGGFYLRKWSSNSSELLSQIPESLRELNSPLTIDLDNGMKTLGLRWQPATDHFSFEVKFSESTTCTKRKILSEVAKVFDPLGWLSPVTIRAKILIHLLWQAGLSGDDAVPSDLQNSWIEYSTQLPTIETIRIPRRITQDKKIKQELLGFCDASEQAYAAVVLLRSTDENEIVTCKMISAKSKVAPVKQVSLPRLELCGAVLLIRLMESIRDSLKLHIDGMFGWTDATIVLAWLASPPQRWKTFVANRVAEIQDVLPTTAWNHVKSEDNPADCVSRGIAPSELVNHLLWWEGPSWLSSVNLPMDRDVPADAMVHEERITIKTESLLYKYSILKKVLRITVYCLRFIKNVRKRVNHVCSASIQPPTVEELENVSLRWVRCPVWDTELSILRVGGRLQKAAIYPDAKHQILLPKKSQLTELIIANQHERDLHAGPQALLTALQQCYWIPAARDVVRQFIRRCVVCCKLRAQCVQQKMGELPASRVTPAMPFQRCGVDYAGPLNVTAKSGRGQKSCKSYVCLLICFVSRAIHLELVSELSTEAFLAALRRFVSRRGKPSDIYSDCGTNFVGAKRRLEEYQKLIFSAEHQLQCQKRLSEVAITWHLNPPAAPHFGGIWEAGVKSMKFHLHRVVGNPVLTMEEMRTLLTQIEACLNSRPMTELSSYPNDLPPLTPGHVLIGRPLTALPEPGLMHYKESHLSRWQRVQQMYQHFWKRWSTEHLSRLQQRNKWNKQQKNVKVDAIVLIKDENLPPNRWSLGGIMATHPGADGLVRVVTIKSSTGQFQRPVAKFCVFSTD